MSAARAEIPAVRKILYSLIITSLFLMSLEAAARFVEPRLAPATRSIPTPQPVQDARSDLPRQLHELRRKAGLPIQEQVPIPMLPDLARGWKLPPNSTLDAGDVFYRFNSLGLRGPELEAPSAGEIRLMTLGDSSVFGDSVKEDAVFSSVAASSLSRRWQRKVVGVIGATPGHDSRQSLQTLQELGRTIQPTWVVIANLWSDVYRIHSQDQDSDHVYFAMQTRLHRLAFYRILHRSLSPWLQSRRVKWIESMADIGAVRNGTPSRVPLVGYVSNLRRMVDVARSLGARVAFVILAAPMDLDKVPPPDTVQEYRTAMRRLAQQVHAPLVNGPEIFQKTPGGLAYFFDQVHPTQEGHQLLGNALSEALEAIGPPPEGASHYQDAVTAGAPPAAPLQPSN